MTTPFEATAADAAPDDRFFVLRDCRALLRRLAETARLAGRLPCRRSTALPTPSVTSTTNSPLPRAAAGFDQITGLTASRITLMCDADLESTSGSAISRVTWSMLAATHCGSCGDAKMTLLSRAEMPPGQPGRTRSHCRRTVGGLPRGRRQPGAQPRAAGASRDAARCAVSGITPS